MKIPIVSDEEAETADYVVCVPADTPSPFDDNLTGFCCECGIKVIYRWHAPRKPKRLCMDCFVKNPDLLLRFTKLAAKKGDDREER